MTEDKSGSENDQPEITLPAVTKKKKKKKKNKPSYSFSSSSSATPASSLSKSTPLTSFLPFPLTSVRDTADKEEVKLSQKNYIYILEGKIGRLERGKTPANIYGLCTDEFTSCNILVLISASRDLYVLIHVDIEMDLQPIREQIAWVGNNANFFLIRRIDSGFSSQPSSIVKNRLMGLRCRFTEIIASDSIEAISIGIGENEPSLSETLPRNTIFHKDFAFIFLKHKLENQFNINIKNILEPLLFNIFEWESYINFDLSYLTAQVMETIGVNKKPIHIVFDALVRIKRDVERAFCIYDVACCAMYYYLKHAENASLRGFLEYCFSSYPETDKLKAIEIILRNVSTFNGNIFKPEDFRGFAVPTGNEIAKKCLALPEVSCEIVINACRLYEKLLPSNPRLENISIPYRLVEEGENLLDGSGEPDFPSCIRGRGDSGRSDEPLLERAHLGLAGLSSPLSMATPFNRKNLPTANASNHSVQETKSDVPAQIQQNTIPEAKKSSSTNFFKSLQQHARQDLVSKNYQGAIEKYNQLIGIYEQQPTVSNRDKAIAHYGMGISLFNLGNLTEAHGSLEKAAELDSGTALYKDKLQACIERIAESQRNPIVVMSSI